MGLFLRDRCMMIIIQYDTHVASLSASEDVHKKTDLTNASFIRKILMSGLINKIFGRVLLSRIFLKTKKLLKKYRSSTRVIECCSHHF